MVTKYDNGSYSDLVDSILHPSSLTPILRCVGFATKFGELCQNRILLIFVTFGSSFFVVSDSNFLIQAKRLGFHKMHLLHTDSN